MLNGIPLKVMAILTGFPHNIMSEYPPDILQKGNPYEGFSGLCSGRRFL